MSLNVRNYSNKEALLFPARIGDYLPKNHLALVIDDVVDTLDLSCLYEKISCVGNPSYHPKMMLKVLFYGYAVSSFSSRRVAKELETDVAFIFLSGMQKPDFRTISDFRKNNIEELPKLFIQIVNLCKELGLVGLGHISIDSTVIKANASKEATHDRERLILEEQAINKKIKELLDTAQNIDDEEDRIFGPALRGDEIPNELHSREKRLEKIKAAKNRLEEESLKQINLTDPDAVFQGKQNQPKRPGYRAQVAVDEKDQIIIACDVMNKSTDNEALIPLVEEIANNIPEVSAKESVVVSADSGYSSMQNLSKLQSKTYLDAYIPDAKYQANQRGKRTDEDSEFHVKHFTYDSQKDIYLCPNQKELSFSYKTIDDKGNKLVVYHCHECSSCKYFGKCTKSPKGRKIKVYVDIHFIRDMRKKLDTAAGKRIYAKRKVIVEPVFGNVKQNLSFREFLLRGLKKVNAEFAIMAIVHNIKKIARFLNKSFLFRLPKARLIPLPTT